MKCLKNNGLVSLPIDFGKKYARMTVRDIEDGGAEITFRSPMSNAHYTYTKDDGSTMTVDQGAALRGCHPIQNTGAVQTYQRKYLWFSLMEVVEHDGLDSMEPLDSKPKATTKPAAKPAAKPAKKTEEPVHGFEVELPTAEDADRYVDSMIDLAAKGHTNSTDDLMAYWQQSTDVIKYINDNFPDAYIKLRESFTAMKAKITGG